MGRKENSLQSRVFTNDDRSNFAVGCLGLRIYDRNVAVENPCPNHAIPPDPQGEKIISTPKAARQGNFDINVLNSLHWIARRDAPDQRHLHDLTYWSACPGYPHFACAIRSTLQMTLLLNQA